MMDRPEISPEVTELVSAACDGVITFGQQRKLDELIASDPEVARYYAQMFDLHAEIYFLARIHRAREGALDAVDRGWPTTPAMASWQRARSFLTRPTPLSMTVAALVMSVLITAMAFMAAPVYRAMTRRQEVPPEPRIVAQLMHTHEAVWAAGQLRPQLGAFLHAGRRMQLESGLVEVAFRHGARVTVEGPATWIVADEGLLQLSAGQLVARVSPEGVGFTVETPAARITDLSTEFGVIAKSSQETETYVFEGRVSLVSRGQTAERARILTQGQGAHVTANGLIADHHQRPQLVHNSRLGDLRGALRAFAGYEYREGDSDPRLAVHGYGPDSGYPDDQRTKLNDLRIGSRNHHDGAWVGWFDQQSLPAGDTGVPQPAIVFDAGKRTKFDKLQIAYLVEHRLAIHAPDRVAVSISDDGKNFERVNVHREFVDDFPSNTPSGQGHGNVRTALVDLHGASGQFVRLEFFNDQQWTFISEVLYFAGDDTADPVPSNPAGKTP